MENTDIARIFNDVADLLEITGANVFRVRAYRNAAGTVESLSTPIASLAVGGPQALEHLPGIGKDLAGKICEVVDTGQLTLLTELIRELPETLVQVKRIPGLGPKRARQIYDTLGIGTLEELEKAARAGRLRRLPGLGETLEARILKGLLGLKARAGRHLLAEAEATVRPILESLAALPEIERLEVAGSYRRRRDTVGDLDVLVAADRGAATVGEHFVRHPQVADVLARGRRSAP